VGEDELARRPSLREVTLTINGNSLVFNQCDFVFDGLTLCSFGEHHMNRILDYIRIPLVVIITLSLLLTLSCATGTKAPPTLEETVAEWNSHVDKVIPDVRRAENIKRLGQQLLSLRENMSADIAELNTKAKELNSNYEATTDEAMALFDLYEQKRHAALDHYRDIILAIRSEVSADEWKALKI
jgi:hypothetical protein